MAYETFSTRACASTDEAPVALLSVRDLRTWFHGGSTVSRPVDGVSFEIEAGQTVGLIGESGCGKSLTALSILGLIDPPGRIEQGSEIVFEGQDLVGLSERDLEEVRGQGIGMIFQEPMTSLNPVYPVGAQIAEAVLAHRRVSRRSAWERAVEMLRIVGIAAPEQRASSYPHELSGGMRQRVMIATALACEPRLLIADEPTTALDVTIQAQIISLMAELQERLGMAILLITHDIGVIAQVADEVAVMYAGRIVEQGSAATVLDGPEHPYTEALLASVPILGTRADTGALRVIPGTVPSPLAWPGGCRFRARCEYAFGRCAEEEPALLPAGGQAAACWLCESGSRHATAGERHVV